MDRKTEEQLLQCEELSKKALSLFYKKTDYFAEQKEIKALTEELFPKLREELNTSWSDDIIKRIAPCFIFCEDFPYPIVYSQHRFIKGLIDFSNRQNIEQKAWGVSHIIDTIEAMGLTSGIFKERCSAFHDHKIIYSLRKVLSYAFNEMKGYGPDERLLIKSLFRHCRFLHQELHLSFSDVVSTLSSEDSLFQRIAEHVEKNFGMNIMDFYKFRYGTDGSHATSADMPLSTIYSETRMLEKRKQPENAYFGFDQEIHQKHKQAIITKNMMTSFNVNYARQNAFAIGMENDFLTSADAIDATIGNNVYYKEIEPNNWEARHRAGCEEIITRMGCLKSNGNKDGNGFILKYAMDLKNNPNNFYASSGYSPLLSLFNNYFQLSARSNEYKRMATYFDFAKKDFSRLVKNDNKAFALEALGINNDVLKKHGMPCIESYFLSFHFPKEVVGTSNTDDNVPLKPTKKWDKMNTIRAIIDNDKLVDMMASGAFDEKTSLYILNNLKEIGVSYFDKLQERNCLHSLLREKSQQAWFNAGTKAWISVPSAIKVIATPNSLPSGHYVGLDMNSERVIKAISEHFLVEDKYPAFVNRFWLSLMNIKNEYQNIENIEHFDFDTKILNKVIIPATAKYIQENPYSSTSVLIFGNNGENYLEAIKNLHDAKLLEAKVKGVFVKMMGDIFGVKIASKLEHDLSSDNVSVLTKKLPKFSM